MNNLVADTAFHEFLLEVLCFLILIHLSAEGTCYGVRQSGLQEERDRNQEKSKLRSLSVQLPFN